MCEKCMCVCTTNFKTSEIRFHQFVVVLSQIPFMQENIVFDCFVSVDIELTSLLFVLDDINTDAHKRSLIGVLFLINICMEFSA